MTTANPNIPPTGVPDPNNPGGGGGVNGAAIGGAIAAGVVIIAAIAFFFIRKRRQPHSHHQPIITKESEATGQQHGRPDPVLPSIENTASAPAPYNYTQINSENNAYNHNYPQINPQNTYNHNHPQTNPTSVYSNNNDYNNYHDNHSNNQGVQVFAMTDRQIQPNSPQAALQTTSAWPPNATFSPTAPTYVSTSPTYVPSYATVYAPPPPIPTRPKNISSTISNTSVPISSENQDHIRELEYQIEMGKQQLAYATQNTKSPNNPQYNPSHPEPLLSGPRGPQGAGIPVVSTATTAPQFDQTELVRKIEKMQAELQSLHAQLKY